MLILSEHSIITMASDERGPAAPALSPRNGHYIDPSGRYTMNFSNHGIFHPSYSNPNAIFDHEMNINDGDATNDNSTSDSFMGSPDSVDTYVLSSREAR